MPPLPDAIIQVLVLRFTNNCRVSLAQVLA
jgi:hypothetical protein